MKSKRNWKMKKLFLRIKLFFERLYIRLFLKNCNHSKYYFSGYQFDSSMSEAFQLGTCNKCKSTIVLNKINIPISRKLTARKNGECIRAKGEIFALFLSRGFHITSKHVMKKS